MGGLDDQWELALSLMQELGTTVQADCQAEEQVNSKKSTGMINKPIAMGCW